MEYIIIIAMVVGCMFYPIIKAKKTGKKGKELLQDFESRMNNQGFTRRVVVYDFLPEFTKNEVENVFEHWWTVGIWIDYQKQLIALRLDRDTWDELVIPFGKIKSVEINEDGHTVTTTGGVVVGGFIIGSGKSKEISKGLQIRIVSGDIRSGTEAYYLHLWDPKYGAELKKSDPNYKAIQECARSIVDEINNIIMYNKR